MAATNLARLGFLIFLFAGGVVLATATPAAAPTIATLSSTGSSLTGTFELQAGSCASGETGSYFRMILPGKTPNGPDSSYITNGNSTCSDQTYTLLSPGTGGGLVTGGYQPGPSPAFDSGGNSLAGQIVQPTAFFGIKFSVDTAATDAQTGQSVPAPTIDVDGSGNLSGNLEAFSAAWNNQYFNQGSPKPGGGTPGLTAGPTGTYNSSTGAFTLDWTSQIVGGPFNSFTGQWHFVGTFDPAPSSSPTTAASTTTATTAATVATVPKSTTSPTTARAQSSTPTASPTSTAAPTPGTSNQSSPSLADGTASPDSSPADSPAAAPAAPGAGATASTLADTGLSIPPLIGLPPLVAGLALLALTRRMSRRVQRVNR